MDCNEIRRLLDDCLLDSLSAAQRSNFDQHLANCRSCFALASVDQVLSREPLEQPRPDLFEGIVRGLAKARPVRAEPVPPYRWQALLGPAAAFALVLSLMFVASLRAPELQPNPQSIDAVASVPPPTVAAPRYIEGEHYTRLAAATPLSSLGDRITAWVFYMWSCLHCYEFEAVLEEWSEIHADSGIDVVRVPVQWNALAVLHARAFYTAEALGVADQIGAAFFNAIHQENRPLDSTDAIATEFAALGVDRDAFYAVFESTAIDEQLARVRRMAQQFEIDSVPAIVIDG